MNVRQAVITQKTDGSGYYTASYSDEIIPIDDFYWAMDDLGLSYYPLVTGKFPSEIDDIRGRVEHEPQLIIAVMEPSGAYYVGLSAVE